VRARRFAITLLVVFGRSGASWAQSSAEQPTARLSVVRAEGADSCADGAAIAREVQARLGRDAVVSRAPRSIEVSLHRDPSRWRATLSLRESETAAPVRRELSSTEPTCAELDAAVALAVALVIDPIGRDAPAAVAVVPPAAAPARPAHPLSAPSPQPPDEWNRRELFSLRAGLSLGSTPLAALLSVSFEGVRRGVVRPWLGAARTIERVVDSFGFSRTSLFAGACFGLANQRFSADLCPAVELGLITSVLFDTRVLEPARPGDYPWLALALSVRGGVRVWGPVSLELGAAPMLSILRQRFAIETVRAPVFEQSIVALDAWLAVRARFF
jgi:hypothetical protein